MLNTISLKKTFYAWISLVLLFSINPCVFADEADESDGEHRSEKTLAELEEEYEELKALVEEKESEYLALVAEFLSKVSLNDLKKLEAKIAEKLGE